ncbi:MAG: FG-GAP-like repeat-containing protein [Planctomycetes bacterium]|nr:FG-GAP-like repeat-containing protein [Planctomycetota bacterium]
MKTPPPRRRYRASRPARALPTLRTLFEAMEQRVFLDASPFATAAFTPLGGAPTIIVGPGGGDANTPRTDLNADGVCDMIVQYFGTPLNGDGVHSSANVSALLGRADGSMKEYAIARYASPATIEKVLAADLNGDGHLDVVVLRDDDATFNTHRFIDVFIGAADGTFSLPNASTDLGSATINDLVTSLFDMNGDGNADVVLQSANKMTVALGTGDGKLAAPVSTTLGSGPTNTSYKDDVNGDGIKDMVMTYLSGVDAQSNLTTALSVYLGKANGTYNTTASFTNNTDNLTLIGLRQLSADSSLDIVAYSGTPFTIGNPASVVVLRNNGTSAGTFTKTFTSSTFANGFYGELSGGKPLQPLLTADLDNNGSNDLILLEGGYLDQTHTLTIHIARNDGNGGFTLAQSIDVTDFFQNSSASVMDVDHDGLLDLVITQQPSGAGKVTFFFNNSTGSSLAFTDPGVTVVPPITVPDYPRIIDINGDNLLDVVYSGFDSVLANSMGTVINNGDRTFTATTPIVLTAMPVHLNAFQGFPMDPLADYTGEGSPDVLGYANNATIGEAERLTILSSTAGAPYAALAPSVVFGSSVTVNESPLPVYFDSGTATDLVFTADAGGFADAAGIYVLINGAIPPTDTAGGDKPSARDLGTLTNSTNLTEFVEPPNGGDQRDRFDVYKFTIEATQRIRVTTTSDVGGTSIALSTSTQNMGLAYQQGFTPAFLEADLTPGTYYVQINHYSGAATNYRFDITFAPPTHTIRVFDGFTNVTSGNTAIDFGSVALKTTDTTRTFRVRNNGQTTLTLNPITLPNGFAVGDDALTTSLAPGESDTFSVRMLTTATGAFSGNITIASDDSVTPSFTIPVSGEVTTPPILTPLIAVVQGATAITSGQGTAIDFGTSVRTAVTHLTKIFTVTNNGSTTLTLGTPTVPSGYTITEALATSLAAGQSDTFTVDLAGLTIGTFSGNISIPNNSGDVQNNFIFPITGTINPVPAGSKPNLIGQILSTSVNGHVVTPDDQVVPGSQVTSVLRVYDAAIGDVDASNVQVTYYLSSNNQLFDSLDVPFQVVNIKKMQMISGDHQDFTFDLTLPSTLAGGNYYIVADIDTNFAVAETIDADNAAPAGAYVPVVLLAGEVNDKTVPLTIPIPGTEGATATIKLSGGGTAEFTPNDDGSYDVVLTNTGVTSSLTITTKLAELIIRNLTLSQTVAPLQPLSFSSLAAAPGGSSPPTGSGALGKLVAKTARLTGTLSAPNGIGSVTLDTVESGAVIDIGAGADPNAPVTLVFNLVTDASLTSAMPIKSLTVTNWTDSAAQSVITAPSIGTLSVKGNSKFAIAGNFEADLVLTDNGTKTLNSAKIAGALKDADWQITGAVGAVTVGGDTDDFTAHISSTLKSLKAASIKEADLTVDDDAGAITATDWLDGSLTAPTAKSLTLKSDMAADVTLTGNVLAKSTISSFKFTGSILGGAWTIAGPVGSVAALSTASAWSISSGATGLDLGKLTLKQDLGGTININSLGKSTVGGNVLANTSITLNRAYDANAPKVLTLAGLAVKGSIDSLTLRSLGGVGALSAASITGSEIFVGLPLDFAAANLPTNLADYTAPAAPLASIKVNSFTDTRVAAGVIAGFATLGLVEIGNGTDLLGIAADSVKKLTASSVNGVIALPLDGATTTVNDFEARLLV